MGALPRDVRITGGAARSRALGAILGAALGSNVRVCNREEAGAAGAAMIAAVATGWYPDMAASADDWVTPHLSDPKAPDARLAAPCDQIFPAFVESRLPRHPLLYR